MITRLTERDLTRIVKRVLKESENTFDECFDNVPDGFTVPQICFGSNPDMSACKKKLKGLNPNFVNAEKKVFSCIDKKLETYKGGEDEGKSELINILTNHLNSMKNNTEWTAMSVAQTIYNDCAHFMNKTDMFSNRPGEPLNTKAPFAPQE